MILFIVACILGLIALGAWPVALAQDEYDRKPAMGLAFGLTIVVIILGILSSATIVSTKSVGVVTSFGKPTGTLSNGLHWIAPWKSVTEFDAAIQTDNHKGDASGNDGTCTTVRMASSVTGCVDNSIRWRIKPDSADDLFRDYKDFDKVRDSLVTRELNASLNEVFSKYDPLSVISNTTADKPGFNLDEMAKDTASKLSAKVGSQIEVLNVIISLVRFDKATEDRIAAYQTAQADTRIAKQKQETAAAEAKANEILANSLKNDPNVLVSKCLDMLKAGYAAPPGFSCWPGGNGAMVLPATK